MTEPTPFRFSTRNLLLALIPLAAMFTGVRLSLHEHSMRFPIVNVLVASASVSFGVALTWSMLWNGIAGIRRGIIAGSLFPLVLIGTVGLAWFVKVFF